MQLRKGAMFMAKLLCSGANGVWCALYSKLAGLFYLEEDGRLFTEEEESGES